MLVNKTEAAKLAGVSRRTLYVHIKEKGISVVQDDSDGLEKIDISELERVYGIEKISSNRKKLLEEDYENEEEDTDSSHKVTLPHTEIRVREQQKEIEKLNTIIQLKEEAHSQRIDDLENTISEIKEKANAFQLLIEDQRANKDSTQAWENSFKTLEARIANQEKSAKEREEREQKILRQNRALKRALDEEKSKSIWKKLFG